MPSILGKMIREQEFYPKTIGLLTNPVYIARKNLVEHITPLAHRLSGKLLDIGCGTKPYQKLFDNVATYVGLELDTPNNRQHKNADIFFDGIHIPCADAEFDSIFMSQVLEHVFEPDQLLQEINRILKPNGQFLLTVPFMWDEHEQPHDYGRYSSFGIKYLLEKHGFTILEHRKSVADIRVIFQLAASYTRRRLHIRNRFLKLLSYVLLIGPLNIWGSVLAKILPAHPDQYLDNIVLVKK